MKWDRHFIIGLAFALPSAFFILASYGSGPLCGSLAGVGSSCGSLVDYEILSIGAVLGFLAAAEFIVAHKRKTGGELFWESEAQRMIRESGMVAMLIGALLGLFMFFKIDSPTVSTLAPWDVYGAYGVSFYSGLVAVVAGAALILFSRLIKIKPMKVAAAKVLLPIG